MLLALEGLMDPALGPDGSALSLRPYVAEAERALISGYRGLRENSVLSGHEGGVYSAVFSPDGTRILTASPDNTARLWSAVGEPIATLTGHEAGISSAVFSPDGARILTASEDKTARLWSAQGEPLATLTGHDGGCTRRSTH